MSILPDDLGLVTGLPATLSREYHDVLTALRHLKHVPPVFVVNGVPSPLHSSRIAFSGYCSTAGGRSRDHHLGDSAHLPETWTLTTDVNERRTANDLRRQLRADTLQE